MLYQVVLQKCKLTFAHLHNLPYIRVVLDELLMVLGQSATNADLRAQQ
jgi:hypothetical protein